MRMNKLLVAVVAGALLLGLLVGFLLRPAISPDKRIGELEAQVAEVEKTSAAQKQRADGLDKEVEKQAAAKKDLEQKLEAAQKAEAKVADSAEQVKKDAEGVQAKLKTAASGAGTVFVVGDEVHLAIANGALFKGATEELTPNGMKVLDKVAVALKDKDLANRMVAVHGHSDGSNPPQPPPPPKPVAAKPAPAAKPKPGQKPAPPPPAPVVKRVTNWEFSAERAAAVVRYLQDKGKIAPYRLGVEAFGPYRPVKGRATSRIEIVLSPIKK